MMRRQFAHANAMTERNWQLDKPGCLSGAGDRVRLRVYLAEGRLDRDLPNAGGADMYRIGWVDNLGSSRFRQAARRRQSPDQNVSVEQQPHLFPSNAARISSGS